MWARVAFGGSEGEAHTTLCASYSYRYRRHILSYMRLLYANGTGSFCRHAGSSCRCASPHVPSRLPESLYPFPLLLCCRRPASRAPDPRPSTSPAAGGAAARYQVARGGRSDAAGQDGDRRRRLEETTPAAGQEPQRHGQLARRRARASTRGAPSSRPDRGARVAGLGFAAAVLHAGPRDSDGA